MEEKRKSFRGRKPRGNMRRRFGDVKEVYLLVESTAIDSDDKVKVREDGGGLFVLFDVFVFGISHYWK